MGNVNECIVCETNYPDGKSLIDGRCPDCRKDFLARRRGAKRGAGKPETTEEED